MNVKPTETDTATGLERNKLEWHHWLRPAYFGQQEGGPCQHGNYKRREDRRRPETLGGAFD